MRRLGIALFILSAHVSCSGLLDTHVDSAPVVDPIPDGSLANDAAVSIDAAPEAAPIGPLDDGGCACWNGTYDVVATGEISLPVYEVEMAYCAGKLACKVSRNSRACSLDGEFRVYIDSAGVQQFSFKTPLSCSTTWTGYFVAGVGSWSVKATRR